MLKSCNGFTIISLVITVILLSMLLPVIITTSTKEINIYKDKNYQGELIIIRQAIASEYTKAQLLEQTGKFIEDKSTYFVGKRIQNSKELYLPDKNSINYSKDVQEFYLKTKVYPENCVYQEDYYYLLDKQDLEKIGVQDCANTYIVNYKTGEVYNFSVKTTSKNELLYLPKISSITKSNEINNDFNDGFGN